MKVFVSFLVTVICFAIFSWLYWIWTTRQLGRQVKKAEPKPVPTMFDVRRLLQEGKKDAALRMYSQIFKVSAKKARKDVEELARSLEV